MRVQQELGLQTTLGQAFMAIKGLASPDVEHAYTRARELCRQIEETPQLFPILSGLQRFYVVRADLQTARDLGQQLLSLAQHQQDPALLLEAHRALGNALTWLGEIVAAHRHLEQGITLYDPQQHRSHAFLYGRDPGVDCLSYVAWVLWMLGYPARALRRSHDALTLAQALGHPYSLAQVLLWAAILHQCRQERALTQERATELITLCTAQGFTQWLATGTIHWGWALATQGQRAEGVAQIRQGLDALHATGARVGRPYQLALLAEVSGNIGQPDEGLKALTEALVIVHFSGGYWCEAELYRLKGELLLAQEDTRQTWMETEACFHQALGIARRQQAKSLELRAAMSLSRLWQRQGKRVEARQLLADIYSWFTEGFDTADLRDAKALLEELEG
jgi:predicted ATPase